MIAIKRHEQMKERRWYHTPSIPEVTILTLCAVVAGCKPPPITICSGCRKVLQTLFNTCMHTQCMHGQQDYLSASRTSPQAWARA